jgi:hypothetical protein
MIYFHGSATKFKVGDLLLPPRQTGARRYNDADHDAVYVSADLLYAIFIATDSRGEVLPAPRPPVWLYQVEPIGELKPHITEILWGFGSNNNRGAACSGPLFTVPKAKVLTRTVVPAFFNDYRGYLIRNYFQTYARRKDHFLRVNIDQDHDPGESPKWQITRGMEKRESFTVSWEESQNPVAKQRQSRDRVKRFYEFLRNRADELVEAADEAPDVFRDLLDAVDFSYERCGDCGNVLKDREKADGFCLSCNIERPD